MSRKRMIRTLVTLLAMVVVFWLQARDDGGVELGPSTVPLVETAGRGDVAAAYREHRSDVPVEVTGTVDRTLPDDREGSRHQRFILDLGDGLTVLVAHNIDLAPRVPLRPGDRVTVCGDYEWNERGGVIHWTHHDPGGRHRDGWIEHDGKRYG